MSEPFSVLLRDLMLEKKMSASDLARKVWGTTKDKRGYTGARNRDRIGHYLAGASVPDRENVVKIAKALGVPADTLTNALPPKPVRVQGPTHPGDIVFNIKAGTKTGTLTVNKIELTVATAMKIMDVLEKDPVLAASRKARV